MSEGAKADPSTAIGARPEAKPAGQVEYDDGPEPEPEAILTKDGLLALAGPGEPNLVELPDGAGFVHVRTLSCHERDGTMAKLKRKDGSIDESRARARWNALFLCDEAGNACFTETEAGSLPAPIADAIFERACLLNGMGGGDDEDDAEGN